MRKQIPVKGLFSASAIAVFTYLSFRYPFSLGGTLMLGILIAAFIVLEMITERLSYEFKIIRAILVVIMGINFLSYWEISGRTINVFYLFVFFGSLFWMIPQYISLVLSVLNSLENLNESEQLLIKEIKRTLLIPIGYFGIIFSVSSGIMVHFIREVEPQTYISNAFLRISYVAVGMLSIFFLISFIYLRKVKDREIEGLLTKAGEKFNLKSYDGMKIRRYSLFTIISIVIIGTSIELSRGMWIIWIETILLISLMSLIIWKLYKQAFESKTKGSGLNI